MRILQVVQRYGREVIGGAEMHVRRVSELLAAKGFDVEVFSSTARTMHAMSFPAPVVRAGSYPAGDTVENGVKVHRYRGWLSTPLWTPFPPSLFLAVRSREKEFEIVNSYTEQFTTVLGRRATRHRPYLWTGHLHTEMFDEGSALTRRRMHGIARSIDYYVPSTEHDAMFMKKRFAKRVLDPVGNGIDPELFDDRGTAQLPPRIIEPGKRYVAYLGRAHRDKGYVEGARAVAALGAGYEDVRYLHIGPMDHWSEATYRSLTPDVRSRVVRSGEVDEAQKRALIKASSVLTLFSRYESFGIVLLEAWMLGVPVVVANRGALPTVVGDDGIVVPHMDEKAYTEAIRRWLDNPEEGRRTAARGRAKALERYTWPAVAERYVKNYKKLLAGGFDGS